MLEGRRITIYGKGSYISLTSFHYLRLSSNVLFFCYRKSEERLAKAHQREMDSQVAEHLRETQNMVHEFSRAQELLKDKVSALQLMYVLWYLAVLALCYTQ